VIKCAFLADNVLFGLCPSNTAVYRAELQILVCWPVMLVALIYYRNRIRPTCGDLDWLAGLFIRRYYFFLWDVLAVRLPSSKANVPLCLRTKKQGRPILLHAFWTS